MIPILYNLFQKTDVQEALPDSFCFIAYKMEISYRVGVRIKQDKTS